MMVTALDPLMERWVRDNIPEWQRILREAEAKGQERRARYARWMLADVLAMSTEKVRYL